MSAQVTISTDEAAAAAGAAAEIVRRAKVAVADHGEFNFAVSGGRSPWLMLGELDALGMPWEHTTIYQVDERVAPAEDPERNLHGLRQALPQDCPARVLAMPVESPDLEAACAEYAADLPVLLDLVHLGLGPDGHTASLVPGDPVLEVFDREVAATGAYQGRRRMTLTFPRIERSGVLLWLVTGAEKAEVLPRLLAGDPDIPAGRLHAADQVVFADQAAAAQL